MKTNGKIYVTFNELSEALGLPSDIEVRLVSAEPADVTREVFVVWFYDPSSPQLPEGNDAGIFAELMMFKEETRRARYKAVRAIAGLWRQLRGEQ